MKFIFHAMHVMFLGKIYFIIWLIHKLWIVSHWGISQGCCVYNSLVDIIKYLLGNAELNKKMDVGWSIPSFNCHWRRHSKLIYHSGKCKRFHWTHTSKDWQSIKLNGFPLTKCCTRGTPFLRLVNPLNPKSD